MKENTVNYPDIANCSQRRLHRSQCAVSSTSTWVPPVHTTCSARSSPSPRMIATARRHQYIQRHVFVRRVTRELNEAISTPPLSGSVSPPPRRAGRISHLSSFSRIYDSHPSTESLFRCQVFFVATVGETSRDVTCQRGRRNKET